MRLRVLALPVLAAVAFAAAPRDTESPVDRAPVPANIIGACSPGASPSVRPPSIAMRRIDNIEWRSGSPGATSWTITPKNPQDWPFAQQSFTGTGDGAAVTPQPLTSAVANHPYAYNVTITCADGSTQVIDPDIIIGDAQ